MVYKYFYLLTNYLTNFIKIITIFFMKKNIKNSMILFIISIVYFCIWMIIKLIPKLRPLEISLGSIFAFIFVIMIIASIITFIKERKK